jgi:hypothetical protein
MKIFQNDALVRFIEESRNWESDAGAFSPAKLSTLQNTLKPNAFTGQ